MKLTTIALATTLALSSTAALAQDGTAGSGQDGTAGYGSVVQPSVGSYPGTVGSTNVVPTWSNTGPAAATPSSSPTFAPVPTAPVPTPSPMMRR
jgi:hypothetical protein